MKRKLKTKTTNGGGDGFGARDTGCHFELLNRFIDDGCVGWLTRGQVSVWLTYLRHADAEGVSYPGPRKLARVASVESLSYIRAVRKRLVAMGLLELVTKGSHQASARYRVTVPASPPETSRAQRLVSERDRGASRPETSASRAQRRGVVSGRDIEHPIEQPKEQHTNNTTAGCADGDGGGDFSSSRWGGRTREEMVDFLDREYRIWRSRAEKIVDAMPELTPQIIREVANQVRADPNVRSAPASMAKRLTDEAPTLIRRDKEKKKAEATKRRERQERLKSLAEDYNRRATKILPDREPPAAEKIQAEFGSNAGAACDILERIRLTQVEPSLGSILPEDLADFSKEGAALLVIEQIEAGIPNTYSLSNLRVDHRTAAPAAPHASVIAKPAGKPARAFNGGTDNERLDRLLNDAAIESEQTKWELLAMESTAHLVEEATDDGVIDAEMFRLANEYVRAQGLDPTGIDWDQEHRLAAVVLSAKQWEKTRENGQRAAPPAEATKAEAEKPDQATHQHIRELVQQA